MNYETIIGLEVHAQLLTKSKMYCACSSDYASTAPNTHVCPVCLGMPGVLPVINRQAVEYVMMTALALNCGVAEYTKFDRKNYAYPDLMKGYQISQFDQPIGLKGWLSIETNGETKKIGITRVHLEEDVAKLMHRNENGETYSLVDVNRSGVPLMEVVGEPDLRSPEEARQYLQKLHSILQYLGVSTGNMEEGSFRCDANISIRPVGTTEYLTKVEVKNMNSFRSVFRALEFEEKRQRDAAATGERIVQETRGWVEATGKTVSQRSKEHAHDYRYFPEPDLPPLNISPTWVEEVRTKLPELPEAKRDRFMSEYGLPRYDADLLTGEKVMADWFESAVKLGLPPNMAPDKRAKAISNWILGEFSRLMNLSNSSISAAKVSQQQLCQLVAVVEKGTINMATAKTVFEEMFNTGKSPEEIVAAKGLSQISDTSAIESAIVDAIKTNPQALADYKAGKVQSVKFLVGQVMKVTKGRANPQVVNELLEKKLKELV